MMKIPLKRNVVTQEMKDAAIRALESGKFQMGPENEALGQELADFVGMQYGVTASSGTGGIHLALLSLDVGPGDEVIVGANGFPSVANCILNVGATPVFVDADMDSFNMDVRLIEGAVTDKTKAIMVQHLYGNPVDMEEVTRIAKKYNLLIVEDGCHALGSSFNGRNVGAWGDAGCFSLMSKHIIAGGDGGIVLTNHENAARRLRYLRDYGSPKSADYRDWGIEELGFNYRLTEILAATGRVNLRYVPDQNLQRIAQAQLYTRLLADIPQVKIAKVDPRARHTYLHYEIWCENRNELQDWLREHGVETNIHYPVPIPLNGLYRRRFGYKEGDFPVAECLCNGALTIPNFLGITEEEITYVVDQIRAFYNR